MAAFRGANSDRWSGPGNVLGQAEFHVYQEGQPLSGLAEAYKNGGEFTVVWFYNPSNAEIDAGIWKRQMLPAIFDQKSNSLTIIKAMYGLRNDRLADGKQDTGF